MIGSDNARKLTCALAVLLLVGTLSVALSGQGPSQGPAPAAPAAAPPPAAQAPQANSPTPEMPMQCPMMSMMKMHEGAMEAEHHLPLIGEDAPAFSADTTQGHINFPGDFKGKWVILFSHPSDFTPVCTTEFMTFATMEPEFAKLNCQLVGLSIDSVYSHIAWLRTIRDKLVWKDMRNVTVTFPVIADLKMDVAKKYGMLQPTASDTKAVRAVFFIDPKAKIRAMMYYPMSNGRNIPEIKRLLIAMQTADTNSVATPANWQPGDDVIIPAPGSCGAADQRVDRAKDEGYTCLDWFLTFKKLSMPEQQQPQ